ncbi:MAG TPA: TonB-dependent receptor [Vitreimonas sp.]|uniref:TonB-dependent receptor domain-containing protein n=1 Tax=Vitreimonas sp. TaxID=3069702 RepID=UPI002D5C3D7D|nr:TonB-dependent receptor [Vitreimonas sp.]HYD88019.1 TonB-dependent receptor [Vitreimonas sp.]
MKSPVRHSLKSLLLFGASALITGAMAPLAHAQDEDVTAAESGVSDEDEIVVVGTQIRGAQVTDVLPVTVLGEEQLDAIAPSSGDELFRSIPQAGDVTFNEARVAGGINDARGDTASINLRGLGTGNTLMLLNGRRMVLHPAIQVENLVPVATVNTNTIPAAGVRRVEVLRDGASAIYGTDAVAGVINTVLRDNFEGLRLEVEGGQSDGMDEIELSIEAGADFNNGRTNVSFFGNFTNRDPLWASDRDFSATSDLRSLIDPSSPFANDTDWRNTSTDTPWPEFRRLTASFNPSTTSLSMNGTTITSTSDGHATFHIQPITNASCNSVEFPAALGTCFDNGVVSTTGSDENLRYNTNDGRTLWSEVERRNAFFFVNHDMGDNVELFVELGVYESDSTSYREQETNLSTQRLIVPATNYWNPFGPTTLNGNPNPNRVPVTNAPSGGVNFELQDYRVVDAGPLPVNVEQSVVRGLVGFRGQWNAWDWETALVQSEAVTHDTMRQPSMTLFQDALARSTPDAYNPFTGGNPLDPANGDSSPNPQSVIDSFMVDVSRRSTTTMTMLDFRLSRPDLFEIWGGPVGVATGVEYRNETYEDDRDARLDGTITFQPFDGSTPLAPLSDVMGASPTPDTDGFRNVFSAFAEMALPIVSPDMNIPLVHSLEAQLAVRYENYSAFGDIARPKVAAAWSPTEWLMFRSAWSQGFRAPNLPQQHERGILRSNTRTDWVRCEAQQQNGVITDFDACNQSQSVQSNRSGSEQLEPETSENFTAGFVIQPTFIPSRFGELTITADYWNVEQDGVIGLLGDSNAITLDYLLRMLGSSNPNVVRAAPTPDDVLMFAGALDANGAPLQPVGEITQVIDDYRNLGPREAEGYDIGIFYEVDDTPLGDWNLDLNFARLLTFYQAPGPEQQQLLNAQAAGVIDPLINIPGAESLIEENGRPKWRASATVTWRAGNWGAGWYTAYVGGVDDTSVQLATGEFWRVKPWITHNAYAQYVIDGGELFDEVRVRIGARNLFDEDPPLADTESGYIGDLHSPRGRTIYASIRTRF